MARKGFEIFFPSLSWAKLVVPFLVMVLPVIFMREAAVTIYMAVWGASFLLFMGLYFYRFALKQDVRMKEAFELEDRKNDG